MSALKRVLQDQLSHVRCTCRAAWISTEKALIKSSTRGIGKWHTKIESQLQNEPCGVHDSKFNSLLIHSYMIHMIYMKDRTDTRQHSEQANQLQNLKPDLTWWLAVSDTLTSREPDSTAYQLVPMSPCRNTGDSKKH